MKKKTINCIQDYVFDYVRSIGVKVLLMSKKTSGILDYYNIGWIDRYGMYYSLFVPANETQVFSSEQLLIGQYSTGYTLARNLRCFHSKSEWLNGRWGPDFADRMDKSLSMQLLLKSKYQYEGYGCRICSIVFATRPVLSVSVVYHKGKTMIDSFTTIIGHKLWLQCDVDVAAFIEHVVIDLGLQQYLEIHTNNDTAERGRFADDRGIFKQINC